MSIRGSAERFGFAMHATPHHGSPRRASWTHVALTCALFLTIWGAKLAIIDRFGSDLPFWDQWDREADRLYLPWFDRGERLGPLLQPHNEHRLVPTLALNLTLVLTTGQWDARAQCILAAAAHAALFVGLFLWLAHHLPGRWPLLAAILLAALGAAPVAWENILSGFQSQFYFLIGFSLLAIHGLLAPRPFSHRWWLGLAAAALALVSMGSGVLCAPPVLALVALQLLRRERPFRSALPTLAAVLLILAAGAALHTSVPAHHALRARTVLEFLHYAARCLSWPFTTHLWLGLLLWTPWFILFFDRLKKHPTFAVPAPTADFLLATGLWVLLQIAAVSFSRAGSGEPPASRYGDVFAIGLVTSFAALACLAPRLRIRHVVATAWLATAATGLFLATRAAWQTSLQNKKADHAAYEHNVHQFVLTDRLDALENKIVPFPNTDWLARVLRSPAIRAILPASVRAPLAIPDFPSTDTADLAPPAPHRRFRLIRDITSWRSAPIAPTPHTWWKIDFAGHLGTAGTSLQLVSATTGHPLATLTPPSHAAAPPQTWRTLFVRAPQETALFVAHTDSPDRWFAFAEPVEVSAISHRARQLAALGPWLAVVGTVALALALLVALTFPPSRRRVA